MPLEWPLPHHHAGCATSYVTTNTTGAAILRIFLEGNKGHQGACSSTVSQLATATVEQASSFEEEVLMELSIMIGLNL